MLTPLRRRRSQAQAAQRHVSCSLQLRVGARLQRHRADPSLDQPSQCSPLSKFSARCVLGPGSALDQPQEYQVDWRGAAVRWRQHSSVPGNVLRVGDGGVYLV
ncbi:hypothetical protein M406DRAFT_358617 [Cryphonectria parasitica EP155]|uniref:Uncharacterized protein n=1 Tax=Cryphonectria parasitica (strain ATCC 38755 / EP155) TaxID=660469 RepID=A0A9P5CJQ2_CRYP1|nr:uncharacterized protein M406DRAFT_358617 [Cryphonectria parasitica EP155]KAF3760367.1 hypothetical protein M406DRAFT_358617 [Cryphonectria parasitica EP155]